MGAVVLCQLPVDDVHHALCKGSDVHVVGDHDDGAALLVQLLEQGHHLPAGLLIQRAGGLVGQQDRGVAHQRPGDGHALLLAAGELVGVVVHAVGKAHALQHLLRALLALAGRHARVDQRQLHVLLGRHPGQQLGVLEDEAHLLAADAGQLGLSQILDLLPVEDVAPGACHVQAADDVHQRGLAAAGRPQHRQVLALRYVQIHVLQRVQLLVAHRVELVHAPHLKEGAGVSA